MNCRASRQTELAKRFPMHVVCAWIGNSQAVAAKHYLHVTDDDFQTALAGNPVQNAVQYTVARGRTGFPSQTENPDFSRECELVPSSANTPIVHEELHHQLEPE